VIVLVTGASGYIAGHVIQLLLQKGFEVRGTVRSLSNPQKNSHLNELFPKLQLYEADLLTPGSFDKAVENCEYIFHTASPFQIEGVTDPQKELIDPAVKGTENVLNSVAKVGKSVKRVILTSSVAAIIGNKPPEYVFSEVDWNMDSTIQNGQAYRLSKRLAEEFAWKFCKENNIDMVAINPGFVVGPPLSDRVDGTSVKLVKGFFGRFIL